MFRVHTNNGAAVHALGVIEFEGRADAECYLERVRERGLTGWIEECDGTQIKPKPPAFAEYEFPLPVVWDMPVCPIASTRLHGKRVR